jgi:hypothetical protein
MAIGKNVAISVHFFLNAKFWLLIIKNQRHTEKFLKLSADPLLIIFYHIIPLLARLKLVRQSFNIKICRNFSTGFLINLYF